MPDLYLAIDFGSSATKLAYRQGSSRKDENLIVSMIPAEIEAIERKQLERYFQRKKETIQVESVKESEEIWIETKGQLYAVGQFALSFEPINRVKDVKYEWASYKILAMSLLCFVSMC